MSLVRAPSDDVVIMAFNREQQLLFWCLGNGSLLPSFPDDDLNWRVFLDLAETHHVIPMVSNMLRGLPQGNIPAEVLSALQAWHLESTRHNLALLMELSKVLDLLKAGGVTAVPFKGPTTAMMAYGDLSLRTCGDVDILVTQSDYPEAESILLSSGYTVTKRYEAAMQSTLEHAESKIEIDLHWGIPPRELDLNIGLLRNNLEDFNLAGKNVPTFSVGDMFLIHCINATKEYWRPTLQQFYDIKMFIEHTEPKWDAMFKRARAIGCERIVMASLLATHNLLTLPLPKPMLNNLKRYSYAGRVAQELENHLFMRRNASLSRRHKEAYFIALTDSPFQRVQRVLGWIRLILTPTSSDREYCYLPRPLSFLYYIVRPIRLLLKNLRSREL